MEGYIHCFVEDSEYHSSKEQKKFNKMTRASNDSQQWQK